MFIVHYALRALLRSPRRTLTGIFGTLLAIGLLSSVLLFVGASEREMTLRTIANVPVDLRAQALTYDLAMQAVETTLTRQKGIVDAQPFTLSHFSASSFSRDQKSFTTGPGAIVAVNESYLRAFPAIKLAQGSFDVTGVVLSQDMGTNLGTRVGDAITLQLPGTGPDYPAKVTGIANLRDADTLFAPTDPKLQGMAFNPPANVVILPLTVFDAKLASRLKSAATGSIRHHRWFQCGRAGKHVVGGPSNSSEAGSHGAGGRSDASPVTNDAAPPCAGETVSKPNSRFG